MIIFYVTLGLAVLFFGGSAVLALAWAVRRGQMQNFQRQAVSIFDHDEPLGELNDYFPGEGPGRRGGPHG